MKLQRSFGMIEDVEMHDGLDMLLDGTFVYSYKG